MQRVRAFFAPVGVIGVAHVACGTAALIAPQAATVSGMAGLMALGADSTFTAFTLTIVGAMAIASRLCQRDRDMVAALVVPQQLILMVQFFGVFVALYNGQYPDGYKPTDEWWSSMWFILADQSPLVAMCISHTIEVALGGLTHEEREFYQGELRFAQEKLERCARCWEMKREREFWQAMSTPEGQE